MALAERTAYSKSSWERYLNGKKLPPREAVEALCELTREPAGRLLALWELADLAWSGRAGHGRGGPAEAAAPEPAAPEAAAPEPGAQRSPRRAPSPTSAPTPRTARTPRSAPTPRPARTPWTVRTVLSLRSTRSAGSSRGRTAALIVAAGTAVAALVAAVVAVITAATGTVGEPPPGPAEPSGHVTPGCRGTACAGRHPDSMACGTAEAVRTLASHHAATGARMEIRYNEACGAAWARLWNSEIGDRIEVSVAPDGAPQRATVADEYDAAEYLFTRMVAAGDTRAVRACLIPASGGAEECFGP
ncbi:DUF2690 domain-containing protein [Streptomyces sp. 8N706]|uniref:DUF2690 domain-containing protein n=1 Tax=Streptomyces sp. 8N706 TaxID=3457416 RepID=UPI003FD560D3